MSAGRRAGGQRGGRWARRQSTAAEGTWSKARPGGCRKAIEASRDVWKSLLKSDLGIDDVATAVRRMDKHELAADGIYKSMISRHSNYPKLLQARRPGFERALPRGARAAA